jgi:hypothetical protein
MANRVIVSLAALLGVGCEPTFDNAHELEELRVLAVRADPPEVGIGDVVTLDTLVASPLGGPVDVRLWECPARGGMGQGCDFFDDAVDLGPGPTASFAVPEAWRDVRDRDRRARR